MEGDPIIHSRTIEDPTVTIIWNDVDALPRRSSTGYIKVLI